MVIPIGLNQADFYKLPVSADGVSFMKVLMAVKFNELVILL